MKSFWIVLLLLVISVEMPAQKKLRFSTQNTVGILVGGTDNAPQVQTINGLAYRNWVGPVWVQGLIGIPAQYSIILIRQSFF